MPFKYKPRDNMNPRKRQRISNNSFPSGDLPLVLDRVSNQALDPTTGGLLMPPPNNDELNKIQIINDLIPSQEDYTFSGISSADLTDLHLLTCDGDKSGSSAKEEVAEQALQIEEECDKLIKIYRVYGSNPSVVRDKCLQVMKDYYEKYGREAR